jgi:hypothetical protein
VATTHAIQAPLGMALVWAPEYTEIRLFFKYIGEPLRKF